MKNRLHFTLLEMVIIGALLALASILAIKICESQKGETINEKPIMKSPQTINNLPGGGKT